MEPFVLVLCIAGFFEGDCTVKQFPLESETACYEQMSKTTRKYGKEKFHYTMCMPKIDAKNPGTNVTTLEICNKDALHNCKLNRYVFPTEESCDVARKHVAQQGHMYGGRNKFKYVTCKEHENDDLDIYGSNKVKPPKVVAKKEEEKSKYPHWKYASVTSWNSY